MNLSDRVELEADPVNVVSLFGHSNAEVIINDPLEELLSESVIEDTLLTTEDIKVRKLVSDNLFPDQSMYILEEQLSNLRESINRIKFYLGDIEDLLPR